MDQLQEMHSLGLLTTEQWQEIRCYVEAAPNPSQPVYLPESLWEPLYRATMLHNFDPESLNLLPN